MWRTGFTFKVRTPHLKFGSWNDSRVSTVFLVWIKPNILWIRLRPALRNVNLTEAAVCVSYSASEVPSLGSKWMTRHHCRPLFLFWPPNNAVSPQTDRPVSVPSTVFGLVQYLVFQGLLFVFGFVSFFFPLPRQSVSLSNKNLEAKFSQYFFQPPDKNL